MASSPTILFIEDSTADQNIIAGILRKVCGVVVAATIAEARMKLENDGPFDLILLDVVLPDGDGFQFFTQLQAHDKYRDIPVIFLTGKSAAPDEVLGFSLGAEDYIVKPYDPMKVRARIEGRLRKITEQKEREPVVRKEGLRIDMSHQKAYVKADKGHEDLLDLTPLEFKILSYLMRHEDHVFTRDQLISAIWGVGVNVIDRAVDMHMSNLRKKIGASTYTIRSVHGVGYRFAKRNSTAER